MSALNSDYLFVFILAAFLGFQLIKKVSPLLHSPLMSLTNAIAAVVIVGAITITGIDNPIYYNSNTQMLFGDAKDMVGSIAKDLAGGGSGLH